MNPAEKNMRQIVSYLEESDGSQSIFVARQADDPANKIVQNADEIRLCVDSEES